METGDKIILNLFNGPVSFDEFIILDIKNIEYIKNNIDFKYGLTIITDKGVLRINSPCKSLFYKLNTLIFDKYINKDSILYENNFLRCLLKE